MNLSYSLKGTVVSDGFSTDVTVTVSGDIPPEADFKSEARELWTTANAELEKRVVNMKKRHSMINRMREIRYDIMRAENAKAALDLEELKASDPAFAIQHGYRVGGSELRAMRQLADILPEKQQALAKIEADLAANE